MNRNKKAKLMAIRSITAMASVLLGVLITAQWRSIPARVSNPISPYSSLKETKEELYKEQETLRTEIKDLHKSIETIQVRSSKLGLSQKEKDDLLYKKAQAGLTKLNGPGIIITYDDSNNSPYSEESIVHAADLRDTVNVLWGSLAEAISINGERIVIDSSIDCIVNTILVNNTRISNPFRIEVIGNQELLYERLTNPDILQYVHERKEKQGLIFEVEKNDNITVPIFNGSYEVKTEGGADV